MNNYDTIMTDVDIKSKICYCCNKDKWYRNKNANYYDYSLIGEFFEAHRIPVDTLDQMIKLIELFNKIKFSIKRSILNFHRENCCKKCNKCGTKTPYAIVEDPVMPDSFFEEAITHYSGLTEIEYIVLHNLSNCVPEMIAINVMIGMQDIKNKFLSLLKFLSTTDRNVSEYGFFMHMMICGPPGHGKTEIAKLLGKAFHKSGLLTSDKFIFATRADLIGAYCGHTAKNTTSMFDKARGGVIFIDEVYALGNVDQKDSFTKECIDTINQLLSERTDTLCIIAGYEDEMERCFFAYNMGLKRRFPWCFIIKPYDSAELSKIFLKKIADLDWSMENDKALQIDDIEENMEYFQYAGGDIANLVTMCIISHHSNVFPRGSTMILSRKDILEGLKTYLHDKKKTKKKCCMPPQGMYI